MTPPNLSVNIDKNIATENSSEKSHDITTIDFSINKSLSTPNCLCLETPLKFPINNDLTIHLCRFDICQYLRLHMKIIF